MVEVTEIAKGFSGLVRNEERARIEMDAQFGNCVSLVMCDLDCSITEARSWAKSQREYVEAAHVWAEAHAQRRGAEKIIDVFIAMRGAH